MLDARALAQLKRVRSPRKENPAGMIRVAKLVLHLCGLFAGGDLVVAGDADDRASEVDVVESVLDQLAIRR